MKNFLFLFGFFIAGFLEGKICLDIKDSNFTSSSEEKRLENSNILLNFNTKRHDIIILTDFHIRDAEIYKKKYKKIIAWIIEPKCIIENATKCYSFVDKNIVLFDYVLTFDEELLNKFPDKCLFVPALPGRFLEHSGYSIPKSKLCSFITSSKKYSEGHKFRHNCLDVYKRFFHDFKDGNTTIPFKDPYLNDFCFSIVIENNLDQNFYFSEKINECFEKGVIPIYAGPKGVEKFFFEEGIIRFNSLMELENILKNLKFEDYYQRLDFVEKNYEISKKFNFAAFLDNIYLALEKVKDDLNLESINRNPFRKRVKIKPCSCGVNN